MSGCWQTVVDATGWTTTAQRGAQPLQLLQGRRRQRHLCHGAEPQPQVLQVDQPQCLWRRLRTRNLRYALCALAQTCRRGTSSRVLVQAWQLSRTSTATVQAPCCVPTLL